MKCQAKIKSGAACSNGAYFKLADDSLVCGVHSRGKPRQALPKIVKNSDEDIKTRRIAIEAARIDNVSKDKAGSIVLSRLKMMKAVPHIDGFESVFPNYRHSGRRDGIGLPSLSPMTLGPVMLPWGGQFLNIENFHQFSKAYEEEVTDGQPNTLFWENYKQGMIETIPHRHKPNSNKGKKKPLFFVWLDKDKNVYCLDYVTSRQFYCTFYERLALAGRDIHDLHARLLNGYNLNIVGYDAHPMKTYKQIEEEYLCPDRPFGHERVLFTILVMKSDKWPWRKFKTFIF